MRDLMGAAGGLLLALVTGGLALGEEVTSPSGLVQGFEVAHSSALASKRHAPTAVTVSLRLTLRRADGGVAPAFSKATFMFPKGMAINRKGFRTCELGALLTGGPEVCPRGSRVGTGLGTADTRLVGTQPWASDQITVFNGRQRRLLLFNRPSAGPGFTEVAVLTPSESPGRRVGLSILIPIGIPETPANPPFKDYELTLGATRSVGRGTSKRSVSFIANPRTCVNGAFRWTADLYYQTGEHVSSDATASCRARRPAR
jgi:hypothetical protein